jgi:hypothetical protein
VLDPEGRLDGLLLVLLLEVPPQRGQLDLLVQDLVVRALFLFLPQARRLVVSLVFLFELSSIFISFQIFLLLQK